MSRIMKRYWLFFKIVTLLGLLTINTVCFAVNNKTAFIAFSDIHFNPFYTCQKNSLPCPIVIQLSVADFSQWHSIFRKYDTTITTYRNDTNYGLLASALTVLGRQNKYAAPKFAIITGDFLGHDFKKNYQQYSSDLSEEGYRRFVKKTLQFLALEIQKTFPETPVYPVIGNNDSYGGDYAVAPSGRFFADFTNTWLPLLRNKQNQKDFSRQFPTAGYYVVSPPHEKSHRIIVLDTVLFSAYIKGGDESAANVELAWLRQQLQAASAKHQKVWLVFHIPVGVDAYHTIRHFLHIPQLYWQPGYVKKFLEILDCYSSVVTGIITGHLHMDGFSLIKLASGEEIANSFVPAISPLFGNNPAFKIYEYNSHTFQLQDFKTYFLNLANNDNIENTWRLEYDFNHLYQPDCAQCDLLQGMHRLTTHGSLAKAYRRYFAVSRDAQPITQGGWLPYYWCVIQHVTAADYKRCLKDNN
jgi:sphingomyelin phosphodiesterase acid-like 3